MSAPPPQSNYDIIVLIPLAFLLRPAIGLLDIQKSKKGFAYRRNIESLYSFFYLNFMTSRRCKVERI